MPRYFIIFLIKIFFIFKSQIFKNKDVTGLVDRYHGCITALPEEFEKYCPLTASPQMFT